MLRSKEIAKCLQPFANVKPQVGFGFCSSVALAKQQRNYNFWKQIVKTEDKIEDVLDGVKSKEELIAKQNQYVKSVADHYNIHNPTYNKSGKLLYSREMLDEVSNLNYVNHHEPRSLSDKFAWGLVRILRVLSDLFFRRRYLHRAVVLETVAAVPGMVGGTLRHLRSLRRMRRDYGWIMKLLEEAENERMHLLTWIKVVHPTLFERSLVILAQGIFYNAFFVFYLAAPRTAHRFVGYLEEEACKTYTHMLHDIDSGKIPNTPAPDIAIDYWNLPKDATIRDVVLVIRADELMHRDVNHELGEFDEEAAAMKLQKK